MPRLVQAVPDTVEGVERPVVHEITRDLLKRTGLDPSTLVFYPGEHDKAIQPGSSITKRPEGVTTVFDPRVTVVVTEDYLRDRILSTAVLQAENRFIFRDDRIETSIKPAYAPVHLEFEIRYRAADKASAQRWRDAIEQRVAMGESVRIHSVTYSYLIPPAFLQILEDLHAMRERVAGYGETYEEFFRANASQRVSLLSNLSGQQTAWAAAETQMRVSGWYGFDGAPERGEKDAEGDSWTISFSYHLEFDKPIACVMSYPLVIHNQVVPKNRRPAKSDGPDRVEQHAKSFSASSESFYYFERGHLPSALTAPTQPGVAIPDYDEFIPASIHPSTLRICTSMVTIDPEDPSNLLDLKTLSTKWVFDPLILAYMRRVRAVLPKLNYSPLHVSLYAGRDLIDADVLEVDADLIVRAKVPLDLRQYYHVRLSLLTLWRRIDPRELDRLREEGDTLAMLLDAAEPGLGGELQRLSTGYVTRAELDRMIDRLDRATIARGNGQFYGFRTVQSLSVEAQPPGASHAHS